LKVLGARSKSRLTKKRVAEGREGGREGGRKRGREGEREG